MCGFIRILSNSTKSEAPEGARRMAQRNAKPFRNLQPVGDQQFAGLPQKLIHMDGHCLTPDAILNA